MKSEEEKDWARGLVSEGKRQEAKPAEARVAAGDGDGDLEASAGGWRGNATSAREKGIT